MMRAMHLEFPEDPACDTLDRQYMLGGSLLVAPVLTEEGSVSYYLPEGRWTHLLTGEVQAGGRWHQAKHHFLSLPIFVRPNTLLPLGARDDRPDYEYADGVTLVACEIAEGAKLQCQIPGSGGEVAAAFLLQRQGKRIEVMRTQSGVGKPWRLRDARAGASADGSRDVVFSASDATGGMVLE
jgi:alpha-D-xyloside xylohydrolase